MPLDTSLNLRDEGISGFTGEHRTDPDRHGLACFLEAIRTGYVKPGDYLLIENLDRLSRESEVPALNLFTGILTAGVRIVQLSPERVEFNANSGAFDLMRAILELSRGHSESKMKSRRVNEAWEEKREQARKAKKPVSKKVPAWIDPETWKPVEDKKAVVLRIFRMATDGYGCERIAKTLNSEGVTVLSEGKRAGRPWGVSSVYSILTSESVFGRFQPCVGGKKVDKKKRKAAGDPIDGYYPAILTEAEYHAAHRAIQARKQTGGRATRHVNIWQGLLKDARNGGSFSAYHSKRRGNCYFPLDGKRGLVPFITFPMEILDDAIITRLTEIKASDVRPDTRTVNRLEAVKGEKKRVEDKIKKLRASFIEGDENDENFAETMRGLSAKLTKLTSEEERLNQEAASPRCEQWATVKTLADEWTALGRNPDYRTKLRGALRRVVKRVLLLVINPRGGRQSKKVVFVQIDFYDSKPRTFVIDYWPAAASRSWQRDEEWAISTRKDDVPEGWSIDTKKGVENIERLVKTLNPASS